MNEFRKKKNIIEWNIVYRTHMVNDHQWLIIMPMHCAYRKWLYKYKGKGVINHAYPLYITEPNNCTHGCWSMCPNNARALCLQITNDQIYNKDREVFFDRGCSLSICQQKTSIIHQQNEVGEARGTPKNEITNNRTNTMKPGLAN